MFTYTCKYTDYNDQEVEETLHFNLTETELSKLSFRENGTFADKIRTIVNEKNPEKIMNLLCEIIDMSYGIRDSDGKHFVKNDEVLNRFRCSIAYDTLCMQLIQDADLAAKFISEILPAKIRAEVNKQ